MATILCVLYDDPSSGYPSSYPRSNLPKIESYPDGQTLPTPTNIDFNPGDLLGSVSGELGLRRFVENLGHQFIVTAQKDGPDSIFEKYLSEAEVIISQPFWPAYLTKERITKAKKLKLAITAGIGSDHVDLDAAMEQGITVAEVTYCNSISVAEHTVMLILSLVRNYIPSHEVVRKGGWNIADCAMRSYDLEGMSVGVVGSGRIGQAVLKRLKPFDVKLHYTDNYRLPLDLENEFSAKFHSSLPGLLAQCDVITLHCPLYQQTDEIFKEDVINKMKRGSYLINTARGKICSQAAVVKALQSGQLAGYAGDVWYPQPAPADHPWRSMPNHGMTPHVSGTTLSAQARYAAGVREILECWLEKRPIRQEYLIVADGKLAGVGAHSYTPQHAKTG